MKQKGKKKLLFSNAQGDKAARVEQARGDVAVFDKLYEEYQTNPNITRERLIIETIEQVLPKAELYIMHDDGNTIEILPDSAVRKRNKNG